VRGRPFSCCHATILRTGFDIGPNKVVALEEQGLARESGKRVAEAVAVRAEGRARDVQLLRQEAGDLDSGTVQEQIQFTTTRFTSSLSTTMVASRTETADMSRRASWSTARANLRASGAPNRMATMADVSMTISGADRAHRSR
jgi:hypothetical protein